MEAAQKIPPTLEYAAAPSKRRKWIFRAIALLLIITVAFCGWKWGPAAWSQAKLLYWQRQCLNYTAPPDQVVYEEEPAAAAKLRASSSDYVPYTLRRGFGRTPSANPPAVTAAAFMPACWLKFYSLVPNVMMPAVIGPNQPAVIFLHEMKSPAGHYRLVDVKYDPETSTFTSGFIPGYNYNTDVIIPAGWTTPASQKMQIWAIDVLSGYPRTPPLVRMFAGQVDPNDVSHFTVRYQMWGQEDVLDGHLDDKDQITLTPRNLPKEPQAFK